MVGAIWLSLSLALDCARRMGRMQGMLLSSTGGLNSRTTMEDEGASSLRTALASRRIRGGPCSGSNTTARSRLYTTGLRLGREWRESGERGKDLYIADVTFLSKEHF